LRLAFVGLVVVCGGRDVVGRGRAFLGAEAVEAMREVGVDIGAQRSKSVDEFAGREFDYVITVCDNARESCPVFPGQTERVHWSFDDPAAVEGAWEERVSAFRRVRDEIAARLRGWAGLTE
jgi:arsenate reductase